MTLFEEMLAGLRDARLIASPYAKAEDDPELGRRRLALRFEALIERADKVGRVNASYRDVVVSGQKFRVNFDATTGKASSVDGWVKRGVGYYREIWNARYAARPGALAREAITSATNSG